MRRGYRLGDMVPREKFYFWHWCLSKDKILRAFIERLFDVDWLAFDLLMFVRKFGLFAMIITSPILGLANLYFKLDQPGLPEEKPVATPFKSLLMLVCQISMLVILLISVLVRFIPVLVLCLNYRKKSRDFVIVEKLKNSRASFYFRLFEDEHKSGNCVIG